MGVGGTRGTFKIALVIAGDLAKILNNLGEDFGKNLKNLTSEFELLRDLLQENVRLVWGLARNLAIFF